jgi:ABC-type amino acid transport system permease subunit
LVGTFAAGVTLVMGFLERPSRSELWVYLIAQVLMLVIGPIGALLHLQTNLTAGGGQWVLERLLRGAPVLAPLLFSNMGLLGLLVLLDPAD